MDNIKGSVQLHKKYTYEMFITDFVLRLLWIMQRLNFVASRSKIQIHIFDSLFRWVMQSFENTRIRRVTFPGFHDEVLVVRDQIIFTYC